MLAVTLRLFVRARERLWGLDDLFVVLAALSCLAGSIIACLSMLIILLKLTSYSNLVIVPSNGLGKHFYTLSAETRMEYFRVSLSHVELDHCLI